MNKRPKGKTRRDESLKGLFSATRLKASAKAAARQDKERLKAYFAALGRDKRTTLGTIAVVLAIACYALVVFLANTDKPTYTTGSSTGIEFEAARILEVLEDNSSIDESSENVRRGSMRLRVEILSGRYAGDIAELTNYFSALYNINVGVGDKLTVRIDTTGEGTYNVSVYNYYRLGSIIAVLALFVLAVCVIGGRKGLRSLLGLIFSLVSIMFILLPLALKGCNTIIVTLLIILAVNIVCFFLIDGVSAKTVSAGIGSFGGVVASAIFAGIANLLMRVDIFMTEEAEMLLTTTYSFDLKMRGLFICAVLISCTGAVMDISMNICSAVDELKRLNPEANAAQLFRSGMNIGRDAIGTMTNTLVLAFTGSSLSMMIVIYSYGVSFTQLINTDFVAVELIMAISGSIGIIFAVPISALAGAKVFTILRPKLEQGGKNGRKEKRFRSPR